jgi:hypothetical protein
MSAEVQILLAILLYLAFFAWIGWRRGLRSELIVFITALVSWVLLQERGNIFVRMTNMAVRFFGIFASALGGGDAPADPTATNGAFIPEGSEDGFLFLAWIVVVFLAYLISSRPSIASKSRHNAFAALVGVLNGYLFLAVLLPKFSQLYALSGGAISEAPLQTFVNLIVYTLQFILDGLQALWEWVQPLSPVTILVLITLLLALVAITLRSGARAKG